MKRLVVALSLAVAAAAAQAQTADDRITHPSHDNPSLVTALRNWLASKTAPTPDAKSAPKPAVTRAIEPRRHYSAENHQHTWRHAHRYKVTDDKMSKADAAPKDATPKDAALKDAPPKDATPKEATLRDVAPNDPPNDVAPKDVALRDAAPKDAPKDAAPVVAVTSAPAAPPVPTRSIVPTMTTASAEAAPPAAAPALASIDPNIPRTVTTITVMAPSAPSAPSVGTTRPHHGRSECTSGERIMTAYYWEGSHTASGERFNPDGMTAAHRSYPFGTKLMVINPRNGKSVTVTVNDRGPFVKGVTLDLSRGAARAIGIQGNAAVCMAKM